MCGLHQSTWLDVRVSASGHCRFGRAVCVLSQVLEASAGDTLLLSYDSTAGDLSEALESAFGFKSR